MKKHCAEIGVNNHWILDGVGAVTGVPPSQSGGSNRELLPDLQNVMANDGVHFRQAGYKNLADTIITAITGLRSGSLKAAKASSIFLERIQLTCWRHRWQS
jgi:lysophospholipase L1-like esterase